MIVMTGNFFANLWEWFTVHFPTILGAIAILVIGWLVALILAAIVRGALHRTHLGLKLARWIRGDEETADVEVNKWLSRAVYYLALFFVLVAFFQYLGLTLIAEPLNAFLTQIFEYAPRLLGAAILLLIAWFLATLVRALLLRILQAAKIDERFADHLDEGSEEEERAEGTEEKASLARTVSNVAYWVIFLFFVPAVLSTLNLEGMLAPVQGMFENLLAYLPNILGAALILLIGWFGARILQRMTINLFSEIGLDRVSEKASLSNILGANKPSAIIGLIVYVLVLVFAIIAALNALALEAITAPASNMIELILQALPAVFASALVLVIALLIGRVLAGLVTNLLSSAGFNEFLVRLGLTRTSLESQKTPSEVVGYITLIGVMLFASIEAAGLLGFEVLADLIAQLTILLGRVIVSVIIFGIGLYLAGVAKEAIQSGGGPHAGLLAKLARISILILVGSIALRQLGVADEIIIIAFGVLLGAVALTGVIAFGLGGRDIAARELGEWVDKVKNKQ
jgi:hypothetical protein